jgi:DNA end-binding protein Ku
METLRYADEVRDAEPLFRDIEDDPADADLLAVATQLIDRKTAPFKADAFKDHFDAALRELIEAKRRTGKTPRALVGEAKDRPKGTNVVDLMEALRASLGASDGKGRAKAVRSDAKVAKESVPNVDAPADKPVGQGAEKSAKKAARPRRKAG